MLVPRYVASQQVFGTFVERIDNGVDHFTGVGSPPRTNPILRQSSATANDCNSRKSVIVRCVWRRPEALQCARETDISTLDGSNSCHSSLQCCYSLLPSLFIVLFFLRLSFPSCFVPHFYISFPCCRYRRAISSLLLWLHVRISVTVFFLLPMYSYASVYVHSS